MKFKSCPAKARITPKVAPQQNARSMCSTVKITKNAPQNRKKSPSEGFWVCLGRAGSGSLGGRGSGGPVMCWVGC